MDENKKQREKKDDTEIVSDEQREHAVIPGLGVEVHGAVEHVGADGLGVDFVRDDLSVVDIGIVIIIGRRQLCGETHDCLGDLLQKRGLTAARLAHHDNAVAHLDRLEKLLALLVEAVVRNPTEKQVEFFRKVVFLLSVAQPFELFLLQLLLSPFHRSQSRASFLFLLFFSSRGLNFSFNSLLLLGLLQLQSCVVIVAAQHAVAAYPSAFVHVLRVKCR